MLRYDCAVFLKEGRHVMQASRGTAVMFGVVLSVTLCMGHGAAGQSKARPSAAAKPNCQLLLVTQPTATAPGEPVPGAEILVEQGSAERKVQTTVTTDSRGAAAFRLSEIVGTVKLTVKLGAGPIGQLKKRSPKAEKARVVLQVTAGKTVLEHPAEVSLTSTSEVTAGPFSQSLSNIEDN